MPEIRPNTWSAVQSFPAPDGSRTLRVTLEPVLMDSLQSGELLGIRQSYVWALVNNSSRRLMTETEVLWHNEWQPVTEWMEKHGSRIYACGNSEENYRLPRILLDHLKCGRLRQVNQNLSLDPLTGAIRHELVVELADGDKENVKNYLKRERASVEMCVPMSAEEATAFFSETGNIPGVRHTWTRAEGHAVEIMQSTLSNSGQPVRSWVPLETIEVLVWNKVVTPHFRFTYSTSTSKKDSINSDTPWV